MTTIKTNSSHILHNLLHTFYTDFDILYTHFSRIFTYCTLTFPTEVPPLNLQQPTQSFHVHVLDPGKLSVVMTSFSVVMTSRDIVITLRDVQSTLYVVFQMVV